MVTISNNYQVIVPAFRSNSISNAHNPQQQKVEQKDNSKLLMATLTCLAVGVGALVMARKGHFGESAQKFFKGSSKPASANNSDVADNIKFKFDDYIAQNNNDLLKKNSGKIKKYFDGKPHNDVVSIFDEAKKQSELLNNIFNVFNKELSPNNVDKHVVKIGWDKLYKAHQKTGQDGLFSLALTKSTQGKSLDDLKKSTQALEAYYKTLIKDNPTLELPISKLFKENDFTFLNWKTKGFSQPNSSSISAYTPEAKKVTEQYNNSHIISEKIPDGYRDGGRSLSFNADGSTKGNPYREIMFIDRKNDKVLNQTVDNFKDILKRNPNLSEEDQVKALLTYVDSIFSVKKDSELVKLTEKFQSKPIMLGEIINNGAGVCRHRSLLSKIIADEVGLEMTIVRGVHGNNANSGPHIWNEVKLKNGNKYLFDPMQRKYINLSEDNKALKEYLYVDKKAMYN